LRRFTRRGLAHPTYRAFLGLGKAVKTIFLCRYLSSEALRREIHEGINVIENWNGATAFIFYWHEGDFQTNRLDEQELAALSLNLLQICLIYINTPFGATCPGLAETLPSHATGRLAWINTALLSACQSLWNLPPGYERADAHRFGSLYDQTWQMEERSQSLLCFHTCLLAHYRTARRSRPVADALTSTPLTVRSA
jgi:hypothetical protein